MIASIPWIFSTLDFIMNVILICSRRPQVFEFCHILQWLYTHIFYLIAVLLNALFPPFIIVLIKSELNDFLGLKSLCTSLQDWYSCLVKYHLYWFFSCPGYVDRSAPWRHHMLHPMVVQNEQHRHSSTLLWILPHFR